MELRRIQYFVTLAEYLHFSNAADSLYISQSSLSYHIAELELELGVRLFNRQQRRVTLTRAGMELLPIAKDILNKSELLKTTAHALSHADVYNDEFSIMLDDSSQRYDLVGVNSSILKLRGLFPDTKLKISFSPFDELIKSLEDHSCDVGFAMLRNIDTIPASFNAAPISEDRLSLVSVFDMDFSNLPELLKDNPLFLLKGDVRWTKQITGLLHEMNITPFIRWENDFSDMLSRVLTGDGFSVLPHSEVLAERKSRADLKYLDFQGEKAMINLCAIWHKENYNTCILPLINFIRGTNSKNTSQEFPPDSPIILAD